MTGADDEKPSKQTLADFLPEAIFGQVRTPILKIISIDTSPLDYE
jgi:hypothetical protein